MGRKKKAEENYLDYIPKRNDRFPWSEKENNRAEIKVKNRGLFNRIVQLICRRPKYSYIELDDFGSFVWKQIDGEKSIYDIALLMGEEFGKEAEPLFERAVQFFHVLRKNSFILYLNKIEKKK